MQKIQKNYKIDPELYRRAKVAAAAAGVTLTDFTAEAMRREIERREGEHGTENR